MPINIYIKDKKDVLTLIDNKQLLLLESSINNLILNFQSDNGYNVFPVIDENNVIKLRLIKKYGNVIHGVGVGCDKDNFIPNDYKGYLQEKKMI